MLKMGQTLQNVCENYFISRFINFDNQWMITLHCYRNYYHSFFQFYDEIRALNLKLQSTQGSKSKSPFWFWEQNFLNMGLDPTFFIYIVPGNFNQSFALPSQRIQLAESCVQSPKCFHTLLLIILTTQTRLPGYFHDKSPGLQTA